MKNVSTFLHFYRAKGAKNAPQAKFLKNVNKNKNFLTKNFKKIDFWGGKFPPQIRLGWGGFPPPQIRLSPPESGGNLDP